MIDGLLSFMNGAAANIMNYRAAQDTNNTNRLMHDQQLAQNLDMFFKANAFTREEREAAQQYSTSERLAAQLYNTSEREAAQQYNLDMWNRSNQYNSAASQSARLRAAGMNPSALINGAGTTSPVQSSPASVSGASSAGGSSVTPPYMQPFQEVNPLDATVFGQGFLTMAQAFKVMKEAKGLEIDNETRDAKNRATIDNLIAEKEAKLESKKLSKVERRKLNYEITGLKIQNMRQQFQQRKDILVEQREQEVHDKVLRQFEDMHRKAELDYVSQQLANQLAVNKDSREGMLAMKSIQVMSAEIDKMASEKGYIDAQALTEAVKRNGISLDNLSKSFSIEDQKMDYQRDQWLRDAREQNKGVRVIDNMAHYFGKVIGIPVKGIFR